MGVACRLRFLFCCLLRGCRLSLCGSYGCDMCTAIQNVCSFAFFMLHCLSLQCVLPACLAGLALQCAAANVEQRLEDGCAMFGYGGCVVCLHCFIVVAVFDRIEAMLKSILVALLNALRALAKCLIMCCWLCRAVSAAQFDVYFSSGCLPATPNTQLPHAVVSL